MALYSHGTGGSVMHRSLKNSRLLPPEKSAIDANEMVIASSIHRLSPHSHRLHFWNSGNLTRKVKKKIVEK